MKNLNKKIGVIALASMMLVGGVAASGIKADASSLGNGINGSIELGGYMRRGIESRIYSYNNSHNDKIELIGYYSKNNNDFQNAKWYRFSFYDIDDFLDYVEKNYEGKSKKLGGAYKVLLEKEDAVIVVHFR